MILVKFEAEIEANLNCGNLKIMLRLLKGHGRNLSDVGAAFLNAQQRKCQQIVGKSFPYES